MSNEHDDSLLLLEMEQITEQLKKLVNNTANIAQKLDTIADRLLRIGK
tara:strand:- start:518 stop:661 length:144 start_codon:yes stop_codon:yes gene_type:complete